MLDTQIGSKGRTTIINNCNNTRSDISE